MADRAEVAAGLDARAGAAQAKASRAQLLRVAGALVLLVIAAFVVNAYAGGAFLTARNITNVLRQISETAVMAIGETFVIITAGIDLSVGSVAALAGVVMALVANALPFGGVSLVLATLVTGVALGAAAGWINALPVVKLNLPPFITTLAMLSIARGLAYRLAGGRPVPLTSDAFSSIGTGTIAGVPASVWWMAVLVAAFAIVLGRMRFGRYVYALGGNEEAARLAGVRVGTTKTLVYVLGGALSAIAGFLLMTRFSSGSPNSATGYELQAIAAVVVGGTSLTGGRGSIVGTFLGALFIGLLNNVMNLLQIESYTQQIVLGVVILLAVIVDEARKRFVRKN